MENKRLLVVDIETISLNPVNQKGALDAINGRIVCIGTLVDDGQKVTEHAFIDRDERKILNQFWGLLRPTDLLIGHNVLEFDLPFIRQRCWILGVKPSREVNLRKYYTDEVFDTMQIWGHWLKKVKLDDLSGALACGQKNGHGTDVSQWWFSCDLQMIADYCLEDVRLAYRIFCRMNYLGDRCPCPALPPQSVQTITGTVLAG
jgi:DNA polymerase III epsilon subunit-like protein